MTKRDHKKTPCGQCPFRTAAPAGWLGEGSPERFALAILVEDPLPCHSTIDYDDPEWKAKWLREETGKLCAGALTMAANICKISRDESIPRLKPNKKAVFPTLQEFVEHHRHGLAHSWDDDEDKRGLKGWKTLKKMGVAQIAVLEMDKE